MSERVVTEIAQRTAGYRPQLDGLRAFAVLCTVIHHWVPSVFWWRTWFPFGVAGVRLFFVLSGFLITAILLDQRRAIEAGNQSPGLSLRHFFVRRVLRLVPAFYLVLFVGSALDLGALRETLYWHLPYLSNVGMILDGRWLPGITHLWSLAVEEQFYIVWAFVILFIPRKGLVPAIGTAIVAAPVFRGVGVAAGWADMTIAFNPIACLDTLGMGALLAVLFRGEGGERGERIREPLLRACLWIGLPLLVASILGEREFGEVFRRNVNLPMQEFALALVFTWVVARAAVGFRGPIGWVLENRVVVSMGMMSYAIYLFHPIVAKGVVRWLAVGWTYWPKVAMSAFVTISLAWLSWQFIETPARNLGRRFLYVKPNPPD
jgi:peptidoglycan/LPS O-acetylase OafA/YrhL